MSGETAIEWATHTWNPTTGCDRVSAGCDHCYAMTLAPRLKAMGSRAYQLDGDPKTSGPGFLAHEWPDALRWPLGKKKPMRVFVNSMSDLFHDNVSDEYIADVFTVMAQAEQHTFQILTKRHARMRSLLSSPRWAELLTRNPNTWPSDLDPERPLDNVWLGVSVENQQWADIRIPALLATPAAIRFLSCEPLLGPINLVQSINREPLAAYHFKPGGIDWVIVGGESGPGSRPMHPDWARRLRDQCNAAGVAFLFKQWGEYLPLLSTQIDGTEQGYSRLGKKAAGRRLDGRTWDEYPTSKVGAA